eukprot:357366-Chlamydomonas_euryale.AAC.1
MTSPQRCGVGGVVWTGRGRHAQRATSPGRAYPPGVACTSPPCAGVGLGYGRVPVHTCGPRRVDIRCVHDVGQAPCRHGQRRRDRLCVGRQKWEPPDGAGGAHRRDPLRRHDVPRPLCGDCQRRRHRKGVGPAGPGAATRAKARRARQAGGRVWGGAVSAGRLEPGGRGRWAEKA